MDTYNESAMQSLVTYYKAYEILFPPKSGLTFNHCGFWCLCVVLYLITLSIGSWILLIIAWSYQSSYNEKRREWAINQAAANRDNNNEQ